MYELRHDTNPQAMPGGNGTISSHRTLDSAIKRYQRETRRRGITQPAWFPAVVIDTETGERIDPRSVEVDD